MADAAAGIVTRFAPTPSGHLHLGHAHAALFAWHAARAGGGRFLLRLEDIDAPRCTPAFAAAIEEDLAWLGIDWDGPVRRQSARMGAYGDALDRLRYMGLLYPCFCTRKEIRAEIARAARAPHGPDGPLYPGTCRALSADERHARMARGRPFALRLHVDAAAARAGPLRWRDHRRGEIQASPLLLRDVVLARKEVAASYHLAVTLDDAWQGVTLVTRGTDLFHATHIHRLLQAVLDLPVPAWHHHDLITDSDGARLAKRAGAHALRALRATGRSPAQVRALAGFPD